MTQTALRLIKKYGQSVVWRQRNDGTLVTAGKPWEGTTPDDHTDHTVYIAFMNVNKEGAENQRYQNQGKIPDSSRINTSSYSELGFSINSLGNVVGLMGQVSFVPSIRDKVLRGTKAHRVVNINNIDPAGPVLVYQVELEF
jgi:hypothetical protein